MRARRPLGLGKGLWAVGLGAYALALIATAPATLADASLQRASEGRLRLAEARGTLWSGSGRIEIRDPSARSGISKDLAWRVVPQSLLRGHLVCDLNLEQASERFPVTLSVSGIEVPNAEIHLPAAVLGLGVPRLAPLGLGGDVLVRISNLSVARGALAGNATLQWRAAASALTPLSPLGDYEVRLQGKGRTVDASLRTIEGPLQLEGKGTWSHGGASTYSAVARVPAQHRAQLAPLLRLIAIERGPGTFELSSNTLAFGS